MADATAADDPFRLVGTIFQHKFLVEQLGIDEFRRLVYEERETLVPDERWTNYLNDVAEYGETAPKSPVTSHTVCPARVISAIRGGSFWPRRKTSAPSMRRLRGWCAGISQAILPSRVTAEMRS